MAKDLGLILGTALELLAPMPATAAAQQVCIAEHARQSAEDHDEDFSSVIRAMEQAAGAM